MRFLIKTLLAASLGLPVTAALADEPAGDAKYDHLFYQAALNALNGPSQTVVASDAKAEPLFHAAMQRAIASYEAGNTVMVAKR